MSPSLQSTTGTFGVASAASEKRTKWLEAWYARLLEETVAQVDKFPEGLGRAASVCRALKYDRPFPASVYTCASLSTQAAITPLPLYVLALIVSLPGQLRGRTCATQQGNWEEAWRVDAKAEEEDSAIGGS